MQPQTQSTKSIKGASKGSVDNKSTTRKHSIQKANHSDKIGESTPLQTDPEAVSPAFEIPNEQSSPKEATLPQESSFAAGKWKWF